MPRFHRLSVMLLSLYTIQLTGLTGRTIRVGLERRVLNVVGSGCAAMLILASQYLISPSGKTD